MVWIISLSRLLRLQQRNVSFQPEVVCSSSESISSLWWNRKQTLFWFPNTLNTEFMLKLSLWHCVWTIRGFITLLCDICRIAYALSNMTLFCHVILNIWLYFNFGLGVGWCDFNFWNGKVIFLFWKSNWHQRLTSSIVWSQAWRFHNTT